MEGLIQCSANYVPLSPISFLERAAVVYGDNDSIVYGSVRFTWGQTLQRCICLASALSSRLHIFPGDVVAALAPNVPALYELHFGVPMAGAILSALNPKLDPTTLATILEQLHPKIIFLDPHFLQLTLQSLHILSEAAGINPPPNLVLIPDPSRPEASSENPPAGSLDYNGVLAMGEPDFEIIRPTDEFTPISVNYTSGSTGNPKGVVYSHRAAYLNSLAGIFRYGLKQMPVFLWTVDMFRCNGWCFSWTMAALGGTNICLRELSAEAIYKAVFHQNVTHLFGAPTLLNLIGEGELAGRRPLPHKVDMVVAGSLPPPQVLMKVKEMGFNVTHAYGMTEALGPVIAGQWGSEPKIHGSQLLPLHDDLLMEGVDVKDPITMTSVPPDGKTMGEVMFRGNTLMMGYHKNPKATQEAFAGGWYRTGDLAVVHPDGYIQMKDRCKDVIVSGGGEKVSTIEIEAAVVGHPMVLAAAVVGRPDDDCLGETACAFVKLKDGCGANGEEIISFCEERLPDFMVPRTVIFGDLPVNSTGKVQKFVLRERVKALGRNFLG